MPRKKLNPLNQSAVSYEDTIAQIKGLYGKLNQLLENGARGPVISNSDIAAQVMTPILSALLQEELWVMSLNGRNRMMRVDCIYRGTIEGVPARMAEVFRMPMIVQARSIIVFHNHPSGNATPSDKDLVTTQDIHKAGKLLDIDVLDHIVVAGSKYASIKRLVEKKEIENV